MNINVPVYIQEEHPRHTDFGKSRRLIIRPLFFGAPVEQDESLQRATARLGRELRREFRRLANNARHEQLAAYGFYPEIEEKLLEFPLELGKRRFNRATPFHHRSGVWPALRVGSDVPEVWIEIARGETLRDRAQEAFTRTLQGARTSFWRRKRTARNSVTSGKAWLSTVEVTIDIPKLYTPPIKRFLLCSDRPKCEGAEELERVGSFVACLVPRRSGPCDSSRGRSCRTYRTLGR